MCDEMTIKKEKSELKIAKHSFISNIETQKAKSLRIRGFFPPLRAPLAVYLIVVK